MPHPRLAHESALSMRGERKIWALICLVVVLGFFAAAVVLRSSSPGALFGKSGPVLGFLLLSAAVSYGAWMWNRADASWKARCTMRVSLAAFFVTLTAFASKGLWS